MFSTFTYIKNIITLKFKIMAWKLDNYEGDASKPLSFSGGANSFPFSTYHPNIKFNRIGREILTDEGLCEIYKAQHLHFVKVKNSHSATPYWTLAQNGKIIANDARHCEIIAKPTTRDRNYVAFCCNDFDGGKILAIVDERDEKEMEAYLKVRPTLRVCGQSFSYIHPKFQKSELKDSDFDWTVGDGVVYL